MKYKGIASKGYDEEGPYDLASNLRWCAHVQMLDFNEYCYYWETDVTNKSNNGRCNNPCTTHGIV